MKQEEVVFYGMGVGVGVAMEGGEKCQGRQRLPRLTGGSSESSSSRKEGREVRDVLLVESKVGAGGCR